jgi:hypothetical protein
LNVDDKWDEIRFIITSGRLIFDDLINYWSLINEPDEDNVFSITSLVRGLD